MFSQYLVAETNSPSRPGNDQRWQPTSAKTIGGAKRAARLNQAFQGTCAHVAFVTADAKIVPLAVYEPGQGWTSVE